jgi:hypothetical protein
MEEDQWGLTCPGSVAGPRGPAVLFFVLELFTLPMAMLSKGQTTTSTGINRVPAGTHGFTGILRSP